jgi:hypothetical protein
LSEPTFPTTRSGCLERSFVFDILTDLETRSELSSSSLSHRLLLMDIFQRCNIQTS